MSQRIQTEGDSYYLNQAIAIHTWLHLQASIQHYLLLQLLYQQIVHSLSACLPTTKSNIQRILFGFSYCFSP